MERRRLIGVVFLFYTYTVKTIHMSMNIKINNYDGLFVPATPLSDFAVINETYFERSGQKHTLSLTTNNLYVYSEPTYEAKLYSNEIPLILDVIKNDISDGAKVTMILDASDTIRTSYVITCTSESGTVTSQRRIIPISLGTTSPNLTIHNVVDNNFLSAEVKYYVEQDVTALTTTLKVAILEVPMFDNSTQYFDVDIKSSDNTATLSYIAKNANVDPNGLNIHGSVIAAFNLAEDTVLDDSFVYAKLTNGTETIYFKLIQTAALAVVTSLDELKRNMSNKWYHLFNLSTAVEVGLLTETEVFNAPFMSDSALRGWLTTNGTPYFDVASHLVTLTDVPGTIAGIDVNTFKAYNESNIDAFTEDEVKDLGASIASTFYDVLDALPAADKENYKHTLNWFNYIKTRDTSVIVTPNLTETQRNKVLSQAKADYQKEFAHAAVVYNNINSRYLEFVIRKLTYVSTQLKDSLLNYEVSSQDVDTMILGLTNVRNLSTDSAAFDTYTESAIDLFVNKLEFLKIKENTIQRINWV